MLVIVPIVILALGGFISLMIGMVGDVIATRDSNNMTYQAQDALSSIERDVSFSTQFLATTGTLTSPQGSDNNFNGTAAFANVEPSPGTSDRLILYAIATTLSPTDSLRDVVYYRDQPNPCTALRVFNKVFYVKIVYFIKAGSLWRRTIMPTYNTNATADINTVCTAPWQQDSCSPGYSATRCKTEDVKLMDDISNLDVEYYTTPGGTVDTGAANATTASTIKVTLTGQKTSAGQDVTVSQSLRATRKNGEPDLSLSFNQQPASKTAVMGMTNTQFTVTPSDPTATIQWQRSTDGGANWANISGATASTLSIPTVSMSMSGYKYRAVAQTAGDSATSNVATLTVTIWGEPDYASGYSDYFGGYSTIGYTKTSAGVVMLKGLVKKSSPVVGGETIATLPADYRPNGILIFQTITNPNTGSRIDVYPDGRIVVQGGDSGWISLEGINFIPSPTSYTRTALTMVNSWANYGGSFSPATFVVDSVGRVNVQGLVRYGTVANGTQIVSNLAPKTEKYMHVPARADAPFLIGIDQSLGIVAKGSYNGYLSLNTMYHPIGYAGWTAFTPSAGWVSYDGGSFFTTPAYTKGSDGIVRLKGLIKGGATADGTVILTLPSTYQPAERTLTTAVCNPNVICRVDILSNGNVELYGANSGWTSLDGITFLAG
jgi:hypothetical protein